MAIDAPIFSNMVFGGNQIQKDKEEVVLHAMSNRFVDDLDKRRSFIYEGSWGEWTNAWKKNSLDKPQ